MVLYDGLSWTTFGIAVGGAAIACALLGSLTFFALRRRRSTQSLETMLRESSTRVEAMITDLSSALDQAQLESARSKQLAEIASTIDLDEVLARTLEAAGAILGVDAAVVALKEDDRGGGPFIATIGLSEEEADASNAGAPDWTLARAALVSYLYPEDSRLRDPIRGSIAVPLRGEADAPLGTLWVFWRASERDPEEAQVALLEELAMRSGPAIENARRFQEARTLADLDALTGLHNYRFFHETLAREVARAHRYERRLALIVLDIDDFKSINDRIGHLAGDAVLAEAAARMRSVVRGADIACRVGGDEFAVIMPESTIVDAERLYGRLQGAMSNWRTEEQSLRLSAGIAELEPEDDAGAFFKRADAALYRAKNLGKGQAISAEAEA